MLNFIREVHPALLKPKQRGKYHDIRARPKQFGELDAKEGIEGAELLEEAEAKGMFDDEQNDDPWQVASSEEEEEDSEGWVDVSSDDEGVPNTDKDEEADEEEEEEDEEMEDGEEDEVEEESEGDEEEDNDEQGDGQGKTEVKDGEKAKRKKERKATRGEGGDAENQV